MSYNKPEITILGQANIEIRGGDKDSMHDPGSNITPGTVPFELED